MQDTNTLCLLNRRKANECSRNGRILRDELGPLLSPLKIGTEVIDTDDLSDADADAMEVEGKPGDKPGDKPEGTTMRPPPHTPDQSTENKAASAHTALPPTQASYMRNVQMNDLDDEEDHEEQKLLRATRQLFEKADDAILELYHTDANTGQRTSETKTMFELLSILVGNKGLQLLKNAVRVNMRYKAKKYDELLREVGERRDIEVTKMKAKMASIKTVVKLDDRDNWNLFEKMGDVVLEIDKQIETFRVTSDSAKKILNTENLDDDGINDTDTNGSIGERRNRLVKALKGLSYFRQQPMIIETACEIVKTFLINPYFIQNKFMNFLFAGPAGTGKTSIVRAVSKVFSAAGIFVYGTVVEGGRDNFIGGYEGQTVGKSMNFLISGLDGVVFVDEAYALTTWNDGVPSSYGAEATSAMVDFMTKYKGLYCLMFAGYEKEMRRYFLGANEGLSRRISYKFKLRDYNTKEMIHIFKVSLVRELGIKDQSDNAVRFVETAFGLGAWKWFEEVVKESTKRHKRVYTKRRFDKLTNEYYANEVVVIPLHKFMYEIFKDQAGSMSNLAEIAAISLIAQTPLSEVHFEDLDQESAMDTGRGVSQLIESRKRRFMFHKGNTTRLMKDIIVERINTGYLGESSLFLEELDAVSNIAYERADMYFASALQRAHENPGQYPYKGPTWIDTDVQFEFGDDEVNDDALFDVPNPATPTVANKGSGIAMSLRFQISDTPNNRLYGRWHSILQKTPKGAWWAISAREVAQTGFTKFFEQYTKDLHNMVPIKTVGGRNGQLVVKELDYATPLRSSRVTQRLLVNGNPTFDVEVFMIYYYVLKSDGTRTYTQSYYQLRIINKYLVGDPSEFIYSYGLPSVAFVQANREFHFTRIQHPAHASALPCAYESFQSVLKVQMTELAEVMQTEVKQFLDLGGRDAPLDTFAAGLQPEGVRRRSALADDPQPGNW